jgi:ribonuclease Z
MELIFLGTAAGTPSKDRNVSSTALCVNQRKKVWLFDCGEGTQRQIMQTNINPNRIENIFITHLHGDHLFGLMPLLSSLSLLTHSQNLTVYGPEGIRRYIVTCIAISQTYISYPLNIVEVEEGLLLDTPQFSITAIPLLHRVPCFGYRIVEKDRLGALDVEKLKSFSIQPASLFQKLKAGETVTLTNGRQLNGMDYLSAPIKGRILALFGDTSPTPDAQTLAQDADVMVHEATVEAAKAEWAIACGHSTTAQAAQLAKDANAKKLILTHISNRYSRFDEERLLDECRVIFPETYIAHDFDVFTLPAKKS